MANKIPILTQLKAVATAAKNYTLQNISELADTAAAAVEEVEQNAVPKTRKVNGKALSADITLSASDVGAAASAHTHSNYVPTTRKVNNKALSADISLTASDVGAAATSHSHSNYVPTTRKVNSKPLSADISLTASDVGAAASGHTHSNYVPTTRKVNNKALSADISLTASDVGAAATNHTHSNYLTTSQRGTANGVASLDADGKVPASQLGAVGLLPQIIITTSAGATASCSGEPLGNEILGALGTGTVKTFAKLPGYGVYTVEASKDGISKSATITVDTVKQYRVDMPLDYSTTLKNNTWSQIDMVSRSGKASSIWSIGDEIDITVSGETLTVVILDFDNDDLADGSGKAGITFGLKNLMKDTREMNSSGANYINTSMHTYLNSTVYSGMPAELRNVIKNVTKKVKTISGTSPTISTANMKLFLLSGAEAGGNGGSGEGTKYSYYATNASRTKYLANGTGSKSAWYYRSPYEGSNTYYYFEMIAAGQPYCTVSTKQGVNFSFCV